MTPIHELLNRIRWDKEFGQGRLEIGYYDRQENTIRRVELRQVAFPTDKHHIFEITDEAGQTRRIPLHRVREVLKNGQVIWQRPGSSTGQGSKGE